MRETEKQPEVLSEEKARKLIEDLLTEFRRRDKPEGSHEQDLRFFLKSAKEILASLEVDNWAKPNGKEALNSAIRKAEAILEGRSNLAEKRAIVPELQRAFMAVIGFQKES